MRRLPRNATIVLATHNRGKARELGELFAPHVGRVVSAAELGLSEPEENAPTFRANAAEKARAAALAARFVAVADDSGLVVPALDGAPGVHSARWAGPERDFERAMRRVHEALGDRDRTAAIVTALAIAWPDGHVETFEGRVEGELVWPPRGEHRIGYEPMFRAAGETRTYGEMPRPEKHANDARAHAFAALRAECLEV
jgi:XTP/dITP diphosphohydrolase